MIICDKHQHFYEPVRWVFELIKQSYGIDLFREDGPTIHIGTDHNSDIRLSSTFYEDLLTKRIYDFAHYFGDEPIIRLKDGLPDYISTVFYLVNGFQEFELPSKRKDKYGRLKYEDSLQCKFRILEENLVEKYIQKILGQFDPTLHLPKHKSRIFISHDIDSVYGSLKYDGIWALRKGRIADMLKVVTQTVLSNPPWFNMDQVARIENEYDVKACYYWIVQNGRSEDGIKNGDYSISNSKIQRQLRHVVEYGNEVGLHKSTMKTDFKDELSQYGKMESNRFHFLKIKNPDSYREMEDAGITSDSSIGFPYQMGFKNSFGMPYFPYDIERKKSFNVLEIPLQIMDGMFGIHDEQSSEDAYRRITSFIEKNATNTVVSILWHNSEMTNFAYKWSFKCYLRILKYIADNNFETVLPSAIVKENQKNN